MWSTRRAGGIWSESECWRFYAVPTARVIFMAKKVLTYSVLVENNFGLFQVIDSMR